jgi:hypothetical protein
MFKKIKKNVAVFAVVLLISSSLSSTAIVSPSCWAAADAAEVYVCGSVGCDFGLWDAVYNACIEE